ncbi:MULTISPECIES: hypothetical protein [unclassified Legionella]|uniref:hypothetical protein n=1 Tax=unclassified Legionella TaxID=2622702 RepID=UPI00105521B1|nr:MULTISPECIES: hypothetical protein [unclassified Legionella]MDI9819442.1 hypothetical protein [Legionella sp. PL877]
MLNKSDTYELIFDQKLTSLRFIYEFTQGYSKGDDIYVYTDLLVYLYTQDKTRSFIKQTKKQILDTIYNQCISQDPFRVVILKLNYFLLEGVNTASISEFSQFLTSDTRYADICMKLLGADVFGENKNSLVESLLKDSVNKYNAYLLQKLKAFFPEQFDQMLKLRADDEVKLIDKMLKLDEKDSYEFSFYMQQYVNGFGNINYEGGLLTCAQISRRKVDYEFCPTVLDMSCAKNEFEEYVRAVKAHEGHLKEIFVIAATHWYAGVIEIDESGKANLLIIDSLGRNTTYFPHNIITAFKKYFPDSEIYFSSEKRQHAPVGCSAFSLDDAVHLYTLERYLEEKYETGGLFSYLRNNIISPHYKNSFLSDEIRINLCRLPVSLLRTKQSRKLLSDLFPSRNQSELSIPVNKNNQTVEKSTNETFEEGINTRLEEKLAKMAKYNAKFLLSLASPLEAPSHMSKHSLVSFQERMQNKDKPLNLN